MNTKILNCSHCGKIISKDILNGNYAKPEVTCPECGSQRNFRNGKRNGEIQTYICRDCGYRFS